MRVRMDDKHPCLVCGAPWRVTENLVGFDFLSLFPRRKWESTSGECSRGVAAHDRDAYRDGLAGRYERGWVHQ